MIDITRLTKAELHNLLITYQREINAIDQKTIYSFSYYYYDDDEHEAESYMNDVALINNMWIAAASIHLVNAFMVTHL